MRIICPHCDASYDVPDRMIGAGRTVRCKRCAGTWAVAPARVLEEALVSAGVSLPDAAPPLSPDIADAPFAAEDEHAHEHVDYTRDAAPPRLFTPVAVAAPRATRLTWAAWVLSVVVLGAAVFGFVAERDPIRRAWPASARAYALLRFSPPASVAEVAEPVQDH